MKPFQTSYLLLAALLAALVLLAVLQWIWLGQAAETSRRQLESRLQIDTKRFADDFDREIRAAYFLFQIDAADWRGKDWKNFNLRRRAWKLQTKYPDLIKEFYLIGEAGETARYKAETQSFEEIAASAEMEKIRRAVTENAGRSDSSPQIVDSYILLMPLRAENGEAARLAGKIPLPETETASFLAIKLDETVVSRMLADLSRRYFTGGDAGNYNVEISDRAAAKVVFRSDSGSRDELSANTESDASLALFDLPGEIRAAEQLFSGDLQSASPSPTAVNSAASAALAGRKTSGGVRMQFFDNRKTGDADARKNGAWLLNARHADGSLKKFVNRQRSRDSALGFGVLLLLGASAGGIFFNARRAQILAQRQIDFVSAVSHEFRTPLAVIYSAGENLADGVTRESSQVSRYGNLIKSEGRKLSQMIEQILEFAGAGAGRQKYVFVETRAAEIIDDAVKQCESVITEKKFKIERRIAENLPQIVGDKNALSRAVQNLIVNSLKYADGDKLIKISAENSEGTVKISVEDFGTGIAKSDLSKIFAPFYRARSIVDRQIHGSGLGLSLVKEIADAHDGKITVESEIGRGQPVYNSFAGQIIAGCRMNSTIKL